MQTCRNPDHPDGVRQRKAGLRPASPAEFAILLGSRARSASRPALPSAGRGGSRPKPVESAAPGGRIASSRSGRSDSPRTWRTPTHFPLFPQAHLEASGVPTRTGAVERQDPQPSPRARHAAHTAGRAPCRRRALRRAPNSSGHTMPETRNQRSFPSLRPTHGIPDSPSPQGSPRRAQPNVPLPVSFSPVAPEGLNQNPPNRYTPSPPESVGFTACPFVARPGHLRHSSAPRFSLGQTSSTFPRHHLTDARRSPLSLHDSPPALP